ncbi:hypothetical protein [Undibacterium crateris]|uniref:hypothetical protein n=1 Tax=Undibacterium crateris TaxID=2528175 RepID=UPI001389E55F|nr:hypothetical protein [Undibacterium crateris]NDI85068.1 hypothetical protein [Undibacterium crateris]
MIPARNIGQIVSTHNLASQRRAAGKPVWDRTINIKHILRRDPQNESEEHAASVANEIAAVLRSKIPAKFLDLSNDECDSELLEIVEGMESLRADSFIDCEDYSALEDLNGMLSQLYDWADLERVWLGN